MTLIVVHLGAPPVGPAGTLEVRGFDVGQGLAVALRGPGGRVVLVDAGGSPHERFDPGERIVVPSLLRWSGRRVDALVLSHGDVDHAGGAAAVLQGLEVGEVWIGPGGRDHPLIRRVRDAARERGVPLVLAARGSSAQPAGIPVRVIGPPRSRRGPGTNDGSLVLQAGAAPHRVLLTGDLESKGEVELLSSGEPLRAEVLVVAHHGSRSGSRADFLARVRPDWALVSAGFHNRFGHPHEGVLRRIEKVGARLARTDLDGAIHLRATPGGWAVERFRARDPARGTPAARE
jgi:competence protein ComEC